MAERSLSLNLKKRLINNEPFVYAHLIKYERPYATLISGKHSTDAKRYAYLTDAAVNITFDDGSYATDGTTANGNQIYIADKVYKIGSYSETSEAKATGMTLELGAESLNNSVTASMVITASPNTITASTIDFVAEGFREGDKISITSGDNDGNDFRITGIKTNNTVLNISNIDVDLEAQSATSITLKIVSDELKGPLLEMNDATLKSYHNRDVFIYKVFLDPDDYSIIGAPNLIFKGIISSASLKEDPSTSMRVTWRLTSHWGDFSVVNGRWTNDEVHRALDNEGNPQKELCLKEIYANDLGFQHSDITMHILATYTVIEQETKFKKKKRWWGLAKSIYVPYQVDVEVEREVDLNWSLSAKYIPIVYGIDRVPAIPIFVDTKSNNANNIFLVYTLCEGEIGGIYDMYVEGEPLMCSNLEDYDDRNVSGLDTSGAANSASTIDVVCRGRADLGDTLGGENLTGGFSDIIWPMEGPAGSKIGFLGPNEINAGTIRYYEIDDFDRSDWMPQGMETAKSLKSVDGSGVRDGETIYIDKPNRIRFTFHSGRTDQAADNSLVTIANGIKFKRQSDYFSDTGKTYWGPNHTLSDTAYIVMDCEIKDGATTVPEVEYVVRGKYVDSFNYDFSYLHDPTVDFTSTEVATQFKVGDTVDLKNSAGTLLHADNEDIFIIDKWTMYGPNGVETRFRFSDTPVLGYSNGVPSVTSFYMEKTISGTNPTWHMVTYNHGQHSGTIVAGLTASGATSIPGGIPTVTITDPGWVDIFPSYKNYTNQLPIAFTNPANTNYKDVSFPVTHSSSGTILTMTGATSTAGFTVAGSGENIIRTDAIKLATSANSTTDDYYNGMTITLTITKKAGDDEGDTTTHTRKIIDYDEATQIAQVDVLWDEGKEPYRDSTNYTYTYAINTITDKRVSINPAMQLLDYMTSQTYGKRLDINKDIALLDWLLAARTCDSRGTQTLDLVAGTAALVGDRFVLTSTGDENGTVVAMGRVQAQIDDEDTSVIMEECFGKFSKTFMKNRHPYVIGDIVVTTSGYYRCLSGGTKTTEPTGSNPTGWTGPLTSVPIHKLTQVSGATVISTTTLSLKKYTSPTYFDYTAYSIFNSDFSKFWRYLGWEEQHQRWVTRHQTCGVVDTASSVFNNINGILKQFNGLLSYESGLYVLRIETTSTAIASDIADSNDTGYTKGSELNVRYITNDDIIGSIKVTDPGPKRAYNTMTSTIGDPGSRFQGKQVSFFDSNFLKTDKMVIKSGSHVQPAVSSYFNARINVENALRKSRFGMRINFKLGPKALLLLAGETIAITYDKFDWSGKKFRISNITFNTDCTANVTASEYDDSFYTISTPKLASLTNDDVRTSVQAVLGTPNGLTADAVTMGNIDLNWINGSNVTPANTTEVWEASSNDRTKAKHLIDVPCVSSIQQRINGAVSNSTSVTLDSGNGVLINQKVTGPGISGTVTVAAISGTGLTLSSAQTLADNAYLTFDNTGSYQHSIGEDAQVRYYWIRHKKITNKNIPRYSGWHPTSATAGVTATSTIPEIFYSVTVSSDAQIFTANSLSVIQSPDTIKFTATKNALSAAFVWSTSPSVNLYAATSGGSPITSGSVVYLRKADMSTHTTVSVTATVTSTTPERDKGADNTYFETIAIPRVDSGGAVGADSKSVRLRASSFTFKEAIDGAVTPAYIQFDAVKQNTVATANWAVTDDSPEVSLYAATSGGSPVTTGNTVYMRRGEQTGGFDTNTAVTVTLTCDSIVDTTSIVRLEEGSGNVIAVLSNPAHVLPANYLGAVTNTQALGSGTNIRVYEGTTALAFVTGTPGAAEWALSVGDTANITEGNVTDNGTYATIGPHEGVTTGTDTYKITYTISGKTRKGESFTSFTADQYLTKAKTGAQGEIGYSVNLTANDYSIVYNAAGTSPTPSTSTDITLTAATNGFTDPYFKFTGDGIVDEGSYTDGSGSSDTFTFPVPAAIGSLTNPSTVKVSIQEGSSGGELASDTISIYGVQPGVAGSDGLQFKELKIQYQMPAASAAAPSTPTGGSVDFSDDPPTFTVPSGWVVVEPTGGFGKSVWVSVATAQAASGGTDSSITWTTPTLLNHGDEIIDIYYKKAATAPTPPTTTVLSVPVGWSNTIPSGTDTLFQVIGYGTLTDAGGGSGTFLYVFGPVTQLHFINFDVICTNTSHVYSSDITGGGVVTTGSGTSFEVFRGSTQLTGILTGTPTVDQFKVTATGTNITPSSTYGASISSNAVVFADHTAGTIMSGVSNLNADISYSIAISTGLQSKTVTKVQTFTKTLKPKAPTGYRTYISVGEIIRDSDGAYSADYLDVEFTFNEEGAAVSRDRFRVMRGTGGSIDTWSTTLGTPGAHTDGDLATGLLATEVVVSGRAAVLEVTYTDSAGVKALATAEVKISHDGIETIIASLYSLNDSSIGNAGTGTFADPANGQESGWTLAVPDIGTTTGNTIYVSTRKFLSVGGGVGSWTAPVKHSKYTVGATGGTGAAGSNAKTVDLTVDDYSIIYAADGTTPSPSGNMTLTATSQNFTDGYFKFTGDGISDEGSYINGTGANADTFTFAIPSTHFTSPKSLRVGVAEAAAATTEIAFDTLTITAVKPGVTGSAGIDGLTFVLTNSSHTFSASLTGAVSSYTGSGTIIEVYEGATALVYDGTGTDASTWKTTEALTNITLGSKTDSGTFLTVGVHSGVADGTDESKIIYTVSGKRASGASFSHTLQQSFSKSKIGATGAAGTAAVNSRYPTLYRLNSNTVADVDGGTFANPRTGNTDWNYAVPTMTANGHIVYAMSRIFTSDAASPQEDEWSTPAIYATRVDGATVTGPAGQGIRQANLYKLNDTTLSDTDGGTFANPLTGNTDWAFAVPALAANNDKVYVATRTFTSDAASPQDAAWSTPSIYAHRNDGTDAVNSRYPTLYRLNSTSINASSGTFADPRDNNTSWNYAVPALAANGHVIYAVSRILTSDGASPQESAWSTPAVYATRVDGATVTGPAGQGSRFVSLYNKNDSSLGSTTAGSFATPLHADNSNDGWQYAVPALSADGDKIYVSTRLFTSDGASPQDANWVTPVIYAQREDSVSLSVSSNSSIFSFKNPDDTTPDPTTVTITANQQNQASNLVDGDLSTLTNGTKASFSYSGSSGSGTATWVVTPTGYPVTCIVTNDSLSGTVIISKVVGTASLAASSNYPTFAFKNPNDTTPDPTTVTITAIQQNQTSNLVDGDLATPTNGTKASFSYSGSDGTGTATWVVTPTGYPVTCIVTNDNLSSKVVIPKVVGAASLNIHSNYPVFSFKNPDDTTPDPATITITAIQQNQTSNLVTGDLAVTNGSKSTGSYSGSDGSGTYTWVVTPGGTYPVTCVVTNDSLTDTIIIAKLVGAASLSISSSSPTFSYDNSSDTSATPSTAVITAVQQNQTSNLVDGDLTTTGNIESSFSYSGSGGSGTATWTITPTSSQTFPVVCTISNDSLSETTSITKVVGGDTPAVGARGYSIFTIEESTNGNVDAANVLSWVGDTTFNDANANAIATAVIALAADNYIRPNDRVTVTDTSASKAGTRIYTAAATGTASEADAADFSALVVETFPGSVIVDGTLAADKLTSGFVYTQALQVGSGNTVFNVNSVGDIWSGHATESSATFQVDNTGALIATKATIGGWTVDATSIFTGTEDHSDYTANDGDMTFYSNGTDSSIHAKNFYITTAGDLVARDVTLTGAITATSGAIGGWNVNGTSMYTGTEDHSDYTANDGDMTFYSNGTDSSIHAKNFYITTAGDLVARDVTLTGTITATAGAIGGWSIGGSNTTISSDNITLDSTNNRILISD